MSDPAASDPAPAALDPAVEAWLRAGAGRGWRLDRIIDTSISFVFLFEQGVLKLKKPVDFGFLDFSTPEKRLWAARRELAFNRATAPDIYLDVGELHSKGDGALTWGGEGELVEAVLEMRRFDPEATAISRLPLAGALAEALGRRVARAHAAAPVGAAGAGAAGLGYIAASNAQHLRACRDALGAQAVEAMVEAASAELARLTPLLDERARLGLCRACHGDLHLGNVLIEGGAPVLFDCIEFNDALREIDILYDVAFLFMDLAFRGDLAGANRAFNGWLDEAAREGIASRSGLAALPLFQSVRAQVRAHVRAREGEAEEGRRYLHMAQEALHTPSPRLAAVGGLSGSGKTTRARALAPRMGASPGAAILRTDEIRKRLFGAAPTTRLPPQAYSPEAGERVYATLFAEAREILAAGRSVVLDAVFLRPDQRQAAERLAREMGAPFEGIWLEAPRQDLEARLAARTGDASDADAAVLARQIDQDPGPIAWRRDDSRQP